MRRYYAISASFLLVAGIFSGCTRQGPQDDGAKTDPKPIAKVSDPLAKPKDKDTTPLLPVKNGDDEKQEKYQAAVGDAIRALANRQWDDALAAFKAAQAIDDTDFVKSEIVRLQQQMEQDAGAKETVKNIETVLADGKADEADQLAGEALKLFGGGDDANKLVLLRLQAIALKGVQTKDAKEPDETKFARYRDEARASLDKKENNLRAAVLAMELALQIKDDAALKQDYETRRADLDKYDALRKQAAELRRDPQQLDDALTALQDAAKLWDTPQVRAEIDECQLAAKKRRDTVSVVNFEVRGDVGMPDAGAALADELLPKLKGKFDLVERTQVAKIIDELKLEASFSDDPKQQEQVGKLAKVRYLVLGSVTRKAEVTVRARLVDVRTGLVVQTAKLIAPNMGAALIQMPALAKQLMSDEFDAQPQGGEAVEAAPDKGELLPPPKEDDPAPKVNVNAQPPVFEKNFDANKFKVLAPPADFKAPQFDNWQGKQRNRLLFAAVELGDFLARQRRFGEAQRQFEFALQLDPDNVQIQLRLANVRPQAPPIVVVVQQPGYVAKPRLAVMPFYVQGDPRFVPQSLSYWTPANLAPYLAARYEIVDPSEIYWYMGRMGITMQDLLYDVNARRWLGRAVGVRYFVFGSCIETTSFDVNTYLLDVEFGYQQGGARINVRDPYELRFRLYELATLTTLTPAEQAEYLARYRQQRYVELVAAGRQDMNAMRWAKARDEFGGALDIFNGEFQVRNWYQFCKDRAMFADLERERRERFEAQRVAAELARNRQRKLAADAEAARRLAAAEAAARTPAQRQAYVNFRFQARDSMITQAQVALKTNRFGISVDLFQGAMDVAVVVGPDAPPPPPIDAAVSQDFARAQREARGGARLREAQIEAAREKALREVREQQLADAQKKLDDQRAADKAKLEAVRDAQLKRDKQAYDAGVAQGQKFMQSKNYPAALAAFQGAQRVAHGPEQNETINAFINQIVERQALAAGKTQKDLDAEREKRIAAEAKAKLNEERYKAALQAARQALAQKKLEMAETKFKEAQEIFKTDAVETGLQQVKAARAADLAAAQKADEEKMRAVKVKTLLAEGRGWIDAKKFDKAMDSFQQAKKLAPDNLDVLAGLAQAQSGLQRPKTIDPVIPPKSNLQDLIAAGQKALLSKNYDAAEKALKSASLLDPTNAAVIKGLKDVADGRKALAAAQQQAEYKTALGAGQKALAGKNYPAAIQSFQEALKVVPNDPSALKLLQQAQTEQAQAAAAVNFQKAVDAGQKALQLKNYDAAIQSFQQALKIVPNDPGALKLLQQAQTAQTQAAAAANFQKALDAGDKAMMLKKYADAVKAYTEAKNLNPDDARAKKSLTLAQQALADANQQALILANYDKAMTTGKNAMTVKNYKGAISAYNDALKWIPGDKTATTQLKLAQQFLQDSTKTKTPDPAQQFTDAIQRAETAAKNKKYADAVKAYQDALKFRPKDTDALAGLKQNQFSLYLERGQQYLDNAMWMSAQTDFEAALKLFPNSEQAKKLLQKAKSKMK